tara:strand:+ start:1187 stop:1435 length:249 start_codon:yes stop_codon:yes gene_type:complete
MENQFEQLDSVVKSVIGKFAKRAAVGKEKYGTTLDREDLTNIEWLTHLQEELMDATLYIEKIKKTQELNLSENENQSTCVIS